ncbi:hypothetical protein JTB14_013098 [Gonioctena quinquepunctata]|nr:hypothetical protein JTB14_013098 [Gonioctena quinquepunctata]
MDGRGPELTKVWEEEIKAETKVSTKTSCAGSYITCANESPQYIPRTSSGVKRYYNCWVKNISNMTRWSHIMGALGKAILMYLIDKK